VVHRCIVVGRAMVPPTRPRARLPVAGGAGKEMIHCVV
jgi:hypothetical protein